MTDANIVDRAGAAAEQARRSDAPMIDQERRFRLAAQQPDPVVDPEAAAMPPGAPRACAQVPALPTLLPPAPPAHGEGSAPPSAFDRQRGVYRGISLIAELPRRVIDELPF